MLKTDNQVPKNRYIIFNGMTILLMLLLLARFFNIQIMNYDIYRKQADGNRIRGVSLEAPRGLILDRNGSILVDNYPTYVLYCIPGELENRRLEFSIISKDINLEESILESNYKKYYRSRFLPTKLAKDLSFDQLSRIEENKLALPGVFYKQHPERIYTQEVRASHILGYMKDLDNTSSKIKEKHSDYKAGDLIGWMGLEKQFESILRGEKGASFYQVDAFGREVGVVLEGNELLPTPGKNLVTTIDISIQKTLEQELKDLRGVGILSIPETGEIIACVSVPDYRPELFRGSMSGKDWNQVIYDTNKPLLNRFANGLYPPGSTFKMLTTIALLKNQRVNPAEKLECTGSYEFGDRFFRCWKETGHGFVNLEQAIEQSCNVYFYQTVQRLSLKELWTVWRQFGFGQELGFDFPTESKGIIPDRAFMNKRYGRRGWAKGNLLNMAVGQGEILVTPIQMATYINHLATEGKAGKLHFLKGNKVLSESSPHYSSHIWNQVNAYMKKVVYGLSGTGKSANPKINGLILAGKTGTAENPHGLPHAWFIGFGNKHGKQVSLVLLIENSGHGGEVAAPKARRIFAAYFNQSSTKIAEMSP
ncbi:MAG: penicillin-binding protein 2 [Candidatus Marinimicrobia bacterium]|jgi:penicillin-binding protein 2|nr:penicillin-binding protein 2 [Candidatus Neomarinimicrobiota bacterium]MBT3828178.1 penicillin-binding protein 2 [Candidatus Neomarinimicrobiota bacterium]MBT3997095.1 penicillin-binding protein 2 [Candidatus Neomarinimicrobiota bacterium]MBT4280561.1 penicillin-binding protein 2 [Candidatus Neomarinimicrobiota bacterium]MBT4568954.1 penicillin-binding protein 2 [Candidatus Neomarinimicrobiota bacterium]